ncbi:MAG: hypothetical protein ACTSWP_09530 [Candidatus Freyarchaeota archaeon]|nr:hypothetical protein [Candidatus Freyrarchaeum guaymaensis]
MWSMSIKLFSSNVAEVGGSLKTRVVFDIDEDMEIWWGGFILSTTLPCGNELTVASNEVFCEGVIGKGEYVRSRELIISRRVVPSIPNKVNYTLKAVLSVKKPGTREEERRLSAEKPVTLVAKVAAEPTPVSMSIKGMRFIMDRDTFKPGDEVKLNYFTQNVKVLTVSLIHEANIRCSCPQYRAVCAHVKKQPGEKVMSVEERNPGSGFITLKIPGYAEPSYNYLWEPPEVTYWSLTFGAYSRWYLEVECAMVSGESVKFQIPINVVTEEKIEEHLFEEVAEKFKPLSNLEPQSIEVTMSQGNATPRFKVKNKSGRTLKGITVRISGIKEELFEVKPYVHGISILLPDQEAEFEYSEKAESYQVTIEDNEGNIITKRL